MPNAYCSVQNADPNKNDQTRTHHTLAHSSPTISILRTPIYPIQTCERGEGVGEICERSGFDPLTPGILPLLEKRIYSCLFESHEACLGHEGFSDFPPVIPHSQEVGVVAYVVLQEGHLAG